MSAAVDGEPPLAGLGPAEVALEVGLEEGDVGALEDGLGGVLEGGPLRADLRVEVALEAPRVVGERVVRRVGAEVDRVVGKRPVRDASAAGAAGEEGVAGAGGGVVYLGAVRAHRRLGAVEERGVLYAAGVETPLWLC